MYLSSGRQRKLIAYEVFAIDNGPVQKLLAYFKSFDALSGLYSTPEETIVRISGGNDIEAHQHPTFNILAVIRALKTDPSLTRKDLHSIDLSSPSLEIAVNSKEAAINLGVHLMWMIDCSIAGRYPADYNVAGVRPIKWKDGESFQGFVERAFPQSEMSYLDFEGKENNLTAFNLQTYGHLRLIPTDNLVEHLLLDVRRGEVRIFHHTSFLKAHLRLSALKNLDCPISKCLKMGVLPPQLLLETLLSLQSILFPSHDENSAFVLDRLLKSGNFDPDMRIYEGPVREDPEHFRYCYWSGRLSKLHDAVKNPEPTNGVHRWLERNAKERNLLYIGIIALVLNAVFGLFDCYNILFSRMDSVACLEGPEANLIIKNTKRQQYFTKVQEREFPPGPMNARAIQYCKKERRF